MSSGSDVESLRKWIHLAPGALAFGLPWLGPWGGLAVCAGLLAANLWLLPRAGGTLLWRPLELERGDAPGMIFYPAALLLLAVATRGRVEILAGAWGMLAFGDAAATLVGRRWGRRRLPWHTGKSWIGSFALVGASWLSAVILVRWTAPGRYAVVAVVVASGVAALAAALVESLPWVLDDNLSVTLVGGAALFVGLEAAEAGFSPAAALLPGAVAVGVLAVAARLSGALDRAGSWVGVALATAMLTGGGWRSIVLLAVFVVAGTAAERLRRAGSGARTPSRGARNALANGVVAAVCGLAAAWGGLEGWPALALGGALAAATADTVGGEIGQAVGGRTWCLGGGRWVKPGTDGGVSLAGSLATLGGAALIAAPGLLLGLFDRGGALMVFGAGLVGATVDSLLGGTLERRDLLDNEAVNFLSTLTAAWLAAQTPWIWH